MSDLDEYVFNAATGDLNAMMVERGVEYLLWRGLWQLGMGILTLLATFLLKVPCSGSASVLLGSVVRYLLDHRDTGSDEDI